MLKKEEISAIMPLAGMLAERGKLINTCNGSPIRDLTMASDSIGEAGVDQVEARLFAVSAPVVTERKDSEGNAIVLPSEHGFVKKRSVDAVVAGVTRMKDDARGIVLPAINATRELLDNTLAQSGTARKIIPEVDVYNYDPLWGSAIVDGINHQYANGDLITAPIATLPALTDEQLHALVSSGSKEVTDFIAREDQECPGHLLAIWNIWFQGQPASDSDDFNFLSRMLTTTANGRVVNAGQLGDAIDTRKGYDALISAFLLAHALYDNPIEGVQWGMDLNQFNLVMSAFKGHFGKVISRVYSARNAAYNAQTLIIGMPVVRNWRGGEATDNILLNGDIYKDYLTKGGSIEAIIGNVFSARTISARTILDQRPQFEATYNDVVNTYSALSVVNRQQLLVNTLTSAVIKHVVAIPQELWDTRLKAGNGTKAELIDGIQRYLASGLNLGTSIAVDQVLITLFAVYVYGPLNTDQFIYAMNNYPDQTLAPKVIAAHVLMDMILRSLMYDVYYSSQQ